MKWWTRILAGIGLGGVVGFFLAVIYASLFGSFGVAIITLTEGLEITWLDVAQAFGFGLLTFAYSGAIFGGIPAGILGMVTGGTLIAYFEHRLPEILTPPQVRQSARRIHLIIALILNGCFIGFFLLSAVRTNLALSGGKGNMEILRLMTTETLPAWGFFLGVPSVIYVLAGWWLAPRIYQTLYESNTA